MLAYSTGTVIPPDDNRLACPHPLCPPPLSVFRTERGETQLHRGAVHQHAVELFELGSNGLQVPEGTGRSARINMRRARTATPSLTILLKCGSWMRLSDEVRCVVLLPLGVG